MNTINMTSFYPESLKNKIEKLNNLCSSLDEWEKTHSKEERYGYAGVPYAIDRIREAGVKKIFLFSKNYCGHYEDDDCYFSYWDEDKKEFFEDTWSTRFAYPSFDLYEMPISFSDAWTFGMIDTDAYLEYIKNKEIEMIENTDFHVEEFEDKFGLRVECTGGRKWRGIGYLIDNHESSYRFATPMFRNRYYGTRDFGVATTNTAIVFDPVTNTINECNAQYLDVVDEIDIMNAYRLWASDVIEKATTSDINENYKINLDYSLSTYLDIWKNEHPFDASTAKYPLQEERDKKFAEFKASKMPELIEWVKKNTNKKGIEIDVLAEHIFNKRYSKKI